jgi:hypothetical protein
MSEEYVIINKTAIQQRIDELERKIVPNPNFDKDIDSYNLLFIAKQNELNQILSKSSSLVPELEQIWNAARETIMVGTPPFEATPLKYNTLEDYISKKKVVPLP